MVEEQMVTQDEQKHPKGLYVLFITEMWERFSYYAMRGIFVLFLVKVLLFQDAKASQLYGVFTGFVYLMPILGGYIADRYWGQRKAIVIGGILMALGQFALAFAAFISQTVPNYGELFMYLALGTLILGGGFFKPNISTIVGSLYSKNDPRKDAGFTIFYMGINLGAFICNFIAGTLGEKVGFHWGFLTAGIGMVISLVVFFMYKKHLGDVGMTPPHPAPDTPAEKKKLMYLIGGGVAVLYLILISWFFGFGEIMIKGLKIAATVGCIAIFYSVIKSLKEVPAKNKILVIAVLCLVKLSFIVFFEQAGSSLTLFTDRNTDRMLFGFLIPTSWFQSANPFFIVLLAPLFSKIWMWLSRIKKNPRTPHKYAYGMISLAVSFVFLVVAAKLIGTTGIKISMFWIISCYLFATIGELFISPIGLSMITKLSPDKFVGLFMGVWFGSISMGSFLAGSFATLYKEGTDLSSFFMIPVMTSLGVAIILFIFTPKIKKWLGEVH